ncbi:MAG: hypothetical protein HN494_15535 [Opitutae bacterium]|jgi:hypothetical protein|nr:hypothetical protein [Opitutae bacterium]
MRNLPIAYLLVMFALASFATAFFTAPSYLPIIRNWKAQKLVNDSEMFKSDSLANTTGLFDAGIHKAKIAMLLLPEDINVARNYVELLTHSAPLKAIPAWQKTLQLKGANSEDREMLLLHCLKVAKNRNANLGQNSRQFAMLVASQQIDLLEQDGNWRFFSKNKLLKAEFLAETGKPLESLEIVTTLLSQKKEDSPEVVFLYAKLAAHLGQSQYLGKAGRLLAKFAPQPDETGIEAIRHMTLIHTAIPIADEGLGRCLELLNINPHAKPIDFLRIHALRFDSASQEHNKRAVLEECAQIFDLKDNGQLEIYCRWLGRLRAFPRLLEELPATRARLNEELFKLRMNALAVLERRDDMKNELANAPGIPSLWKLIISVRLHSICGDFDKASSDLDQLLKGVGKDNRRILSICRYFEESGEIRSLCHILEIVLDEPGLRRYALEKLLEYRASTSELHEIRNWISKLRKIHVENTALQNAELYFQLLDPSVPKNKISDLVEQSNRLLTDNKDRSIRITAALARLRNEEPDKALVALGDISDWRTWRETRPAWVLICTQVLRQNQDTRTAIRLESSIAKDSIDLAERKALATLFPDSFQHSQ